MNKTEHFNTECYWQQEFWRNDSNVIQIFKFYYQQQSANILKFYLRTETDSTK